MSLKICFDSKFQMNNTETESRSRIWDVSVLPSCVIKRTDVSSLKPSLYTMIMEHMTTGSPGDFTILGSVLILLSPTRLTLYTNCHDLIATDRTMLDMLTSPVPHRHSIPLLDIDRSRLVLRRSARFLFITRHLSQSRQQINQTTARTNTTLCDQIF